MFQLVTRHLYFGVDAMQLQVAAGRVLMRVVGQPPERATVGLETLAQDFGMSTRDSLALVDQMVLAGLLVKPNPSAAEYIITDKFRQYAQARIVDPLPRARAQLLLDAYGRARAILQPHRVAQQVRDRGARGLRQLHEPRARNAGPDDRRHGPPPRQCRTATSPDAPRRRPPDGSRFACCSRN